MTRDMYISEADLSAFSDALLRGGTRLVGPARGPRGSVVYRPVKGFDEIFLENGPPTYSLKELFLPPTEPLLEWRQHKGDVVLLPISNTFAKQVVLGARPCDVAALPVVDKVMDWDYHDEPWFGRRQATTIISMACPGGDQSCFCTAVGLTPDGTRGADILLVPVNGGFHADILTDKGEALVKSSGSGFKEGGRAEEAKKEREVARKRVEANLKMSPDKVRAFLNTNFGHSLWRDIALRCHGCGACASVCPTCHCFDIVDEPVAIDRGTRRRNWDTCQAAKFTLHGSGHNPRSDQSSRFRQRVIHKFAIKPERFQAILCTGCGRCVRACPGGMDLIEILEQIDHLAGAPTEVTRGAS